MLPDTAEPMPGPRGGSRAHRARITPSIRFAGYEGDHSLQWRLFPYGAMATWLSLWAHRAGGVRLRHRYMVDELWNWGYDGPRGTPAVARCYGSGATSLGATSSSASGSS